MPFLNTNAELCNSMPTQVEEEDGYATVTQSCHEEKENPSMPWWMATLLYNGIEYHSRHELLIHLLYLDC